MHSESAREQYRRPRPPAEFASEVAGAVERAYVFAALGALAAKEVDEGALLPPAAEGHITGHQRPSEAIRGHQRPSEAIRGRQPLQPAVERHV